MRQSLHLGRVAGIRIGVNWSVFVILALIADALAEGVLPKAAPGRTDAVYWAIAAPTAVLFLAALLAHELAHALTARRSGVKVRSITLWMLGGVTQMDGEPTEPRVELKIAAAGPLTSLAVGAAFIGVTVLARVSGAGTLVGAALAWSGLMNVLLGLFNLLPGAPLDGGRILRALVWMRARDRDRADRVATGAGRILGGALMGLGVAEMLVLRSAGGLWLVFIGIFLAWSARAEEATSAVRQAARGRYVRDLMISEPECAPAWSSIRTFAASAMLSRQSAFPVVAPSGEPVGIVTLGLLARTPAGRTDDRIDSIALPLSPEYVAAPDDEAVTLLGRAPIGGEIIAVVVEYDHVVGTVTTAELNRLLQLSRLRRRTGVP